MRWQWLLVLVVAGLLVGCGEERDVPAQPTDAEEAPTPAAGLAKATEAYAAAEQAYQGGDLEEIRKTTMALSRALGSLTGAVTQKDTEAGEEARKAGKQAPPLLMDLLGPGMKACDDALAAILPPNDDVAAAKQALPSIKAALDALQGKL